MPASCMNFIGKKCSGNKSFITGGNFTKPKPQELEQQTLLLTLRNKLK